MMNRQIISLCAALIATAAATAQSDYKPYYESVAANNPSLKALRSGTEATISSNHTGLNLDNPEVEFAYQWGNYYKINVDVSQTFDFATLSGAKKKIAKEADKVAMSEYAVNVRDVLYETDVTLTTLAYYRHTLDLYSRRLQRMEQIDSLSTIMLNEGKITAIDATQSKIELEKFRSEMDLQKVEYESLLRQLTNLNGGIPMAVGNIDYDAFTLPSDFDSWFGSISSSQPDILLAQARIGLSEKNVSLNKSRGLPDFMIGYTNELIRGDNHHGFKVGTSLPLWGNAGAVKAAKAELAASQSALDDTAFRLHNDLRAKYDRAAALKVTLDNYQKILEQNNLINVLEDAYESGRLNVHEYLQQLDDLAALRQNVLDMERDYRLALCELKAATF